MAAVRHRTVEANGISMHVAEAGPAGASAPAVLFVHGFPELWYSWRHQMDHLAGRGYRCLAPDLRGYGGTTAPPDPTSYTIFHLVALLDALQLPQVFVVGHDWGAIVSWNLCLLRPDRVRALVNLSVAFMPRRPSEKPLEYFRRAYGDDYYVCRFQLLERISDTSNAESGSDVDDLGSPVAPEDVEYHSLAPVREEAAVTDIQVLSDGFVSCGGDGSVKLVQVKNDFATVRRR